MDTLPPEILCEILSYCSIQDVLNVGEVLPIQRCGILWTKHKLYKKMELEMKCIVDEFKCEAINGGNVGKIIELIYDKKFAEYPTLYKCYTQFQDDLFEFWEKKKKLICPWYTWDDCCERVVTKTEFWKKKKKLICPWYTWDDCCERVVKTNICSHIITDLLSALFSYWCGTHGRIVVKE